MSTPTSLRPQKTWSHLAKRRRKPSEYEIVSTNLLWHTRDQQQPWDVDQDGFMAYWYRRYRNASPITHDDWDGFRDPDELVYRTYNILQDGQETYVEGLFDQHNLEEHDKGLDSTWVAGLARLYAPGRYLLHTAQMARAYAPDGVFVEKMNFVNNRVVALHAGAEGYFNDRLSYRLKYTCSLNKGSYVGTYVDHYSWQLTPDYYFDDTKVEHYTFYRMDYRVGLRKNLTIFGSVAYDFGDLYRSLGGHLGIKFDLKI